MWSEHGYLHGHAGTNVEDHCEEGEVYAGYHYDLNFLTIHGRSRYPGLHVWLRDGRRLAVRIPQGCLFLQAGKQLEWLTGGYVAAGMHEASLAPMPLPVVLPFPHCKLIVWLVCW